MQGVEGISRFLSRVYRFVARNAKPDEHGVEQLRRRRQLSPAARKVQRKLHQTIQRITDDFGGRWHFNTSIAAIMELVNELYAYEDSVQRGEPAAPLALLADVQRKLVLMLAPFAPYLAAELWEMLGETSDLLRAPWPKYDPALAKEDEVEIAVQVNGKVRSRIVVPADADGRAGARTRPGRREGQSRHRRQGDREGAGGEGQAGEYRGAVSFPAPAALTQFDAGLVRCEIRRTSVGNIRSRPSRSVQVPDAGLVRCEIRLASVGNIRSRPSGSV